METTAVTSIYYGILVILPLLIVSLTNIGVFCHYIKSKRQLNNAASASNCRVKLARTLGQYFSKKKNNKNKTYLAIYLL